MSLTLLQPVEPVELPRGWKSYLLGELSTSGSGTTPSRALHDRYYNSTGTPWVKTLDLTNSYLNTTEERITEVALKEVSIRVFPVGSVLIAMYGGFNQIGRTGLLNIPAAVNQAITVVIPDEKRLDPDFLLRVLNYRVGYWKAVASSSRKDPNITGFDVRRFPLALPPIAEQRAIATALSDVDELLRGLDQLIAKKRDLKRAAMQQLLTGQTRLPGYSGEWKRIRLGDSAILKARIGWQGLTTAEYRTSGEFMLVTGTEIREGKVDWNSCFYVSKDRYDQDHNIQLLPGDVLVTKDGTIGKAAIVGDLPRPATLNSGVFVIRPVKDAFDSRFFFRVLRSARFIEFLNQLAAGSTISHLYQKDFVHFLFEVPPTLAEQKAIATVFDDMDEEIRMLEVRLVKTREIKQGMMQQLLTGKVRLV